MLRRVWRSPVRLFQQLFRFSRRQNQTPSPIRPEPPPELTDTELQFLFTQLLEGLSQGRDQAWALQWLVGLENRVTTEQWVMWLQRFGERLLASPAPNNELAARMVQLGELRIGEVGDVAYDIGMQLLTQNSGEPIWEYEGPDAESIAPTNQEEGENSQETEDDAEVWSNQGYQQYMMGDFEDAIVSYDKALAIKPDFREAWYNRGMALGDLGHFEDAIVSYDKALAIKSDFHLAWNSRGVALANLGQLEDAVVSFDKALAIKSDFHLAWNSRGAALANLGQLEDAIASYDKALAIKSDFHEARYNQGMALYELGQLEDAIVSFDQALVIKSDFHDARYNQGAVLANLGQFEDAIVSFDKALAIKPDEPKAWYSRGTALANLGQLEDAIVSFDKALAIKPDEPKAWNNRGAALDDLGQYEAAIASCDKAIVIKPDFHLAWINRGTAAGSSISCNMLLASLSSIARQNSALNQRGYEGKLTSYQEGLKYCCQDTRLEGCGSLHQAIGNAHYFHGQQDPRPFPYWRKAVRSYEEALKTLKEAVFPELHLEVLQDLIRALSGLGQTAEAEEVRRRGTDLLQRLLDESKSPGKKKQLALKFVGFNQLTVDVLVQSGQFVKALETAEEGKNACLTWLLYAWGDDIAKPGWVEIQQLLNSSTAIVYWHLSPATLTIFVLKHNDPEPIVITTPTSATEKELPASVQRLREFENWVSDWNRQYTDYRSAKGKGGKENHPWRTEMLQRLEQLKQILNIPAILEELSGITQLILIPHRDLHRFPLHALFLLNEQLPDDCTITYLPSAQIGLNLQQHQPNPSTSLLSVEHPTSIEKHHDGEAEKIKPLPSLEFAQIESEVISRILTSHSTRIRSEQATKLAVEDALKQSHSIFHFTGHGTYQFSNPKASALALAGEDRLTVAAICQLPLQGYNLVSLSSCETAITGNQTITTEYVGLVSSFLSCNVAHVISTLWTVESAASALVMIQFYRLLLQQGKSEAVALVKATQWLRDLTPTTLCTFCQKLIVEMQLPEDEGIIRPFLEDLIGEFSSMEPDDEPYSHPYYWAAFTLTGTS